MKNRIVYKRNFFVFDIKKFILPTIFCLYTVFLVVFSNQNLSAAKNGLILWSNNIVPALFPFFIATELLGYTNVIFLLEKLLTPIMRPVFNVPGSGAYALIMGIISGYPIGAKIVTNFRKENICNKEECERLLSFTNNSGPLFIIGTVGISMYSNSSIGILFFITHLLACITVGILFRFWKYKKSSNSSNNISFNNTSNLKVSFSNLGDVLGKSITSAINTILMIGGFVVLFSVVLSVLESSNVLRFISASLQPLLNVFGITDQRFLDGFITGIIELTNGLKQISEIPCKLISINLIITSFLLGFGGFSILLQVLAIVSKTDLSIKPYIFGKLLHGIFAATYTYIFINSFSFFNLNL